MKAFTIDGNQVICEDGCDRICQACWDDYLVSIEAEEPTKAYIGSGEDVMI